MLLELGFPFTLGLLLDRVLFKLGTVDAEVCNTCAKNKPKNKDTIMCLKNMFPATEGFEMKQSERSSQISTASPAKPATQVPNTFQFLVLPFCFDVTMVTPA